MSLATIICRAQLGLEAPPVQVEVSLGPGLPVFSLVGLPATVVKESRERVRAALVRCGFEFPAGRITVNLSPADLPKRGGRFDLPIALGILLASGQIKRRRGRVHDLSTTEFYGELGLSGELKFVPGMLLAAAHAGREAREIVVPRANADEVAVLLQGRADLRVLAADHLLAVCAHLDGVRPLDALTSDLSAAKRPYAVALPDLSDVKGQLHAKRALTIAAAGGHSLLMIGPPGAGKTMLARRLPSLLPPMSQAESLEVAAIASASPEGFRAGSFGCRPVRAPHHTTSAVALVGGGPRARPGEISLAHHGVLFLDELLEYDRRALEALREPLEAGVVHIARAASQARYPAQFQLVAAMNPCPCGRYGDPAGTCSCTPAEVLRYRGRVSGPLMERLDMQVEVPKVRAEDLDEGAQSDERDETSTAILPRVIRAREIQIGRQGVCNARLSDSQVGVHCAPDTAGREVLERAMRQLNLSARARQRVLKLARTIADLKGADFVRAAHVSEAITYRMLDRRG